MRQIKALGVLVYLAAILLLASCSADEKFSSERWLEKGVDWWMTDFRERMVEDLVRSDTLIGMDSLQTVALLGSPDQKEGRKITYTVREKYGRDIDPIYIKTLVLEFDAKARVVHCFVKTN